MRKASCLAAMILVACSGGSSSSSSSNPTKAATPIFSPSAGTYASAQAVTISSTTAGATIRYTSDGSAPTAASPTYTTPVTVSTTTTLRAVASAAGLADSDVASATYTIQGGTQQAAVPTFSPAGGTFTSPQTVTLATTTAGATIHYTTDGSTPTASSPSYGSPIAVSTTTTIKAIAVASGYDPSAVASATYTINLPSQVATPTFSPAPGTYSSSQSVTLSCVTASATIHYTTDGSTPTASSTAYAGPIAVSATTTIKAMAVAPGLPDSGVATGTYTILPLTATPTFQPGGGSYSSAQSVTIACATAGATIYYTTSGATPTTSSSVYSSPIEVSSTTTLQAIATAAGHATSAVGSATYTFSGSSTMDLATFCGSLVDASVAKLVTCYSASTAYATILRQAFYGNFCSQLSKEVAAGRVSYDGTNAGACLTAYQSLSCIQLAGSSVSLEPACAGILTPHVAAGGSCYDDADCIGGECNESETCPGKCEAYLAAGADCGVMIPGHCGPGLECIDGACGTPSQVGGPCPCADGLWCDISDTTYPAGVCKAKQTSGTCDPNEDQCEFGYVCAGTCQPPVGPGGDCSASPYLLCGFFTGYYCGTDNKCTALPVVGQSCTTACSLGSYCDATTKLCTAAKQLGDACSLATPCALGLECDAGATNRCVSLFCLAP